MKGFILPICIFVIFSLFACKKDIKLDEGTGVEPDKVIISIPSSPDYLNPAVSRSSQATHIERLLHGSLLQIDPYTLQLTPYLAADTPRVEMKDSLMKLIFPLREDVLKKHPGLPQDILISINAIMSPGAPSQRLANHLHTLKDVKIEDGNVIIWTEPYFLAPQIYGLLPIYEGISEEKRSTSFALHEILNKEKGEEIMADDKYQEWLSEMPDWTNGYGPYKLEKWQDQEYIRLIKKDDWWGEGEGSPVFANRPDTIEYRIFLESQLAAVALAGGEVDLVADINPSSLVKPSLPDNVDTFSVSLPRYYMIAINHEDPVLKHVEIRQVLNQIINRDFLSESILRGEAIPIYGPVTPERFYFLENRKGETNSLEASLKHSGWKDRDNDGIREKMVDDKEVPLLINIKVSGPTGRKIGQHLKYEADKLGFAVEVIHQKFQKTIGEMRKGDFDLVTIVANRSHLPDDFYLSWHSDQIEAGGNLSRYNNPVMDSLTEKLREGMGRTEDYHAIQELFYNDIPAFYLVIPTHQVWYDKDYQVKPSKRYPGYYAPDITFL